MRTLIVAIIIIVVIVLILRKRREEAESLGTESVQNEVTFAPSSQLSELDIKLAHVVSECGFQAHYELHSHPSKTFTLNKSKMYVCTSCAEDDRLLYMGLHEVAHVLTGSSHEGQSDAHGPAWEFTFRTLLTKAGQLGYLNPAMLI